MHVSGVDPIVRQTKPTITARVKDWFTNDRACRRCTHGKGGAEHAGDAFTRR